MKDFRAIRSVLVYTMILNLLVTVFKLVVGYTTGALSLVADGYDSLFDSASNVVGLVGIAIASRPPDPSHPYGHRKFETLSAVTISILLFVTTVELVQSAIARFRDPVAPEVNWWTFAAILFSVGIHVYVAWYERKRGKELKSEVLVADAMHTRADVLVSLSVLVGMIVVRLGFPIIDAILALIIAVLIAKIGIDIIRDSSKVLADAAVVDVGRIERIVSAVPGVETWHSIRSRGQEDDIHLDLHVEVQEGMPVEQAHHIAHQVQRRLLGEVEGLQDVVIHIEPRRGSRLEGMNLDQQIREIAQRIPGTAVHSIEVHELDQHLYATLHLEVDRDMPVEQAHGLADQLEDMLRTEVDRVADVEIHLEPRRHEDGQIKAVDQKTYRQARDVLYQSAREVGGLSNCHDMVVFREDGELMMNVHCECEASLTVDEAHALSRQLEQQMQQRLPGLIRVVVHVEPRPA